MKRVRTLVEKIKLVSEIKKLNHHFSRKKKFELFFWVVTAFTLLRLFLSFSSLPDLLFVCFTTLDILSTTLPTSARRCVDLALPLH